VFRCQNCLTVAITISPVAKVPQVKVKKKNSTVGLYVNPAFIIFRISGVLSGCPISRYLSIRPGLTVDPAVLRGLYVHRCTFVPPHSTQTVLSPWSSGSRYPHHKVVLWQIWSLPPSNSSGARLSIDGICSSQLVICPSSHDLIQICAKPALMSLWVVWAQ
jgi:hypothetical protein